MTIAMGWMRPLAAGAFLGALLAASNATAGNLKPVSVRDAIEVTRLAAPDAPALFSADRKSFLVLLRRANLKNDRNEFRLYLFRSDEVMSRPQPKADLLLALSSVSDEPAIRDIKWLGDGRSFTFIGIKEGGSPQVYRYDLATRRLKALTDDRAPVGHYDVTGDGSMLVYTAKAEAAPTGAAANDKSVIVGAQWLDELLTGQSMTPRYALYVKRVGSPSKEVPIGDALFSISVPALSSNGHYATIAARPANAPKFWSDYLREPDAPTGLYELSTFAVAPGRFVRSDRYWLIDLAQDSASLLLNTPKGRSSISWSNADTVLIRSTLLPLDTGDELERRKRIGRTFTVSISAADRRVEVLAADVQTTPATALTRQSNLEIFNVVVDQSLNKPPRIVAKIRTTGEMKPLMALYPEAEKLELGRAEIVRWSVKSRSGDGRYEMSGGLYYPPDYVPGKRYPLIIQTHGFNPSEFSMDGWSENSSSHAARPLAAAGFLVLQMEDTRGDMGVYDAILKGRFGGATAEQAFKWHFMRSVEGAIDALDGRGLIDREKIGISGFSRTVCFVAYALTHSRYPFAAAALTDGIDCGYFQAIVNPDGIADNRALNGGALPFGPGLDQWKTEAPDLNIESVGAPLRIVALGKPSALAMWPWYSGSLLLHHPVDFVMLPEASHIVERPAQRLMVMQGLVDWYRFWLQGLEEPGPEKAMQYQRWESLCDMQRKMHPEYAAFCVPTKGSAVPR